MKILFINFNLSSTPGINNGLAVLSSVLKKKKHAVSMLFLCEGLGYGFDLERMKRDIQDFKPDIIGLSLIETQLKYASEFLRGLKAYYKGMVICGGPYPTLDPEGCLNLPAVNAVCVGEGDDALVEMVEAIRRRKDHTHIKNLWFKLRDGAIVKNGLRPFKDLDTLPLDDKELFDLDKILPLKNQQLEVMVGRGCAYRCSYCINQPYIEQYKRLSEHEVKVKDYIRIKKADTVIQEIRSVLKRHRGVKKLAFIDDNFVAYNDFLKEFAAKYRASVGLPFMCNANPLSYTMGKAEVLKDAGCVDVRFGLESGSERVKKQVLNRPVSNSSVVRAFRITHDLKMMTSSFNMIGLPTETMPEVLETLKLNAGITPDTVKVMTFYPFKNTPIYGLCMKMDLIDLNRKFDLDNYDTFSCLKFPAGYRLFLNKVQTAFGWYLNVFLKSGASREYAKMVSEIEAMDESQWRKFDFCGVDKELSATMRKRGETHYSQFINRSLAVKFPSQHLN